MEFVRTTGFDDVDAELCGEDRIPYFTQTGTYNHYVGTHEPQSIKIRSCYFHHDEWTDEQVQELADSLFPKSYRAKVGGFSNTPAFWIEIEAGLTPNDSTGVYNEAGMDRYQKAARKIEAAGYELTWKTQWQNSYETFGDFMAATIDKHGN